MPCLAPTRVPAPSSPPSGVRGPPLEKRLPRTQPREEPGLSCRQHLATNRTRHIQETDGSVGVSEHSTSVWPGRLQAEPPTWTRGGLGTFVPLARVGRGKVWVDEHSRVLAETDTGGICERLQEKRSNSKQLPNLVFAAPRAALFLAAHSLELQSPLWPVLQVVGPLAGPSARGMRFGRCPGARSW